MLKLILLLRGGGVVEDENTIVEVYKFNGYCWRLPNITGNYDESDCKQYKSIITVINDAQASVECIYHMSYAGAYTIHKGSKSILKMYDEANVSIPTDFVYNQIIAYKETSFEYQGVKFNSLAEMFAMMSGIDLDTAINALHDQFGLTRITIDEYNAIVPVN